MANTIEEGPLILGDDGYFSLFGCWIMPAGKTWLIPTYTLPGPKEVATFFEPIPSSPKIEETLNEDIRCNDFHRVKSILVKPLVALILYTEEKITRQDIERAIISDDSVIFPEIYFHTQKGGLALPVKVMEKPRFDIVTLDKDGEMIVGPSDIAKIMAKDPKVSVSLTDGKLLIKVGP